MVGVQQIRAVEAEIRIAKVSTPPHSVRAAFCRDPDCQGCRSLMPSADAALQELEHPNIVQQLDTSFDPKANRLHIFLEFVAFGSLTSVVARSVQHWALLHILTSLV